MPNKQPVRERLDKVRAEICDQELDGLIVSSPNNRYWISGFSGTSATIVITESSQYIFADSRYWEQVRLECPDFELVQVNGADTVFHMAQLRDLLIAKVGYESNHVTVDQISEWREQIEAMDSPSAPRLIAASGILEDLRLIKDDFEIDALSRAVKLGDSALEYALKEIRTGWTEKDVAWTIQQYALNNGASDMSFPTIVASGSNGALPHWRASDSQLISNSGLVIDMGVILDSYASDLTRTIWFSGNEERHVSDKFLRIYDIVLMAQEMAIERIEVGMLASEAHSIAVEVIREAGYGEYFNHGLGHGVGLEVHEAPRLGPGHSTRLEEGQVLTIEPGIYIPGWGGVRIEDQCVMRDGRLWSLTSASKTLNQ